MIEIVDADISHTRHISMRMRKEDRNEIKKFSKRITPIRAINGSLRHSLIAWTVLENGVPIAMFGVCGEHNLSFRGCVWFLGTDAVKRNARAFLTYAREYISKMLYHFSEMTNFIDCDNILAIRFAKKLSRMMPENVFLEDRGDRFLITIKEES